MQGQGRTPLPQHTPHPCFTCTTYSKCSSAPRSAPTPTNTLKTACLCPLHTPCAGGKHALAAGRYAEQAEEAGEVDVGRASAGPAAAAGATAPPPEAVNVSANIVPARAARQSRCEGRLSAACSHAKASSPKTHNTPRRPRARHQAEAGAKQGGRSHNRRVRGRPGKDSKPGGGRTPGDRGCRLGG